MKLNIGTLLGSSNSRINIRNLPTHFLLMLYSRRARPVWIQSQRKFVPLSSKQHIAVRNVLRVRLLPRDVFVPHPEA